MSYKRVVLKWEKRFGKHRRIMKPHKAQKWANEFKARGLEKVKTTDWGKERIIHYLLFNSF